MKMKFPKSAGSDSDMRFDVSWNIEMSASNHNWVCFECRYATRQSTMTNRRPRCPECGDDCYCLGHKVEIPKKSDAKKWNEIKVESRKRDIDAAVSRAESKVRSIHRIEKEIAKLEALEENEGRRRRIKELKKT